MSYRRKIYQNNNISKANNTKVDKQILLKKQKSFINLNKNNILVNLNNNNGIEKSFRKIPINTSSKNNINQANNNENHNGEKMYNNNNIKRKMSYDNNIKWENRKINNLKKDNYNNLFYRNNKNFSKQTVNNNNLINSSNDRDYKYTNLKNITFNYNNNFNNMNNENILWNIHIEFNQRLYNIIISPYKTIGDLLNEIFLKLYHLNIEFFDIFSKFISLRKVDKSLKIYQLLKSDSIINIIEYKNLNGRGNILSEKEINIKFIELDKSKYENNYDFDFNLHGLLKLCLLKEISLKLDSNRIKNYLLLYQL